MSDGVDIGKIEVLSKVKTGESREVEMSVTLTVLAGDEFEAIAWLLSSLESA